MNKQFKLYLQFVFIFLDLFVLSVSFILPKLFSSFIIFSNTDYSFTLLYFWIYSNLLWISLSLICGNYFENVITHFELFTKSSAHVYMLWVMFVLFYLYLYEETKISGLFLLEFIFFFALGLLINRFIYIGVRNYFKNKDYLVNRVLILGYNVTTLKLASYFEEDSINTNLIGFAEDEYKIKELTRYPIVSGIREVLRVAKDLDIQEIYSTITPEQNKFIYTLMEDAEKECIRFKVVPNLSQFFSKPFMVDFIRDLPILSLRSEPLEDVGNKIKKRLLDILISSFVIIFILSWLIPLLGLLIIIQSKGPVLFIQKRTGKNSFRKVDGRN